MKIAIWHNIMWSRYKAAVFSALQTLCADRTTRLQVYQIAETASERVTLSPTDASLHKYPYKLLFKGAYEDAPRALLFWRVAKAAWTEDADITILAGYDRPEYWLQAIILLLRQKTFACFCDSTAYDNRQTYLTGLLKRIFFGWCSGIFCYGQRAAEYVRLYGAEQKKIIHRCQAAALYEGYNPKAALERRLREYDPAQPARFLYVGRLSREKSIDQLMLAFDRLQQSLPESKLILVGSGPDEARLVQMCRELGLSTKVEFCGPKHGGDLFTEYLKATCLILPSFSEPWGLVVNEALSHGCPVVVSNRCGCVPELVHANKTGYEFTWGDTKDCADKMFKLAKASDPARLSQACLDAIAPFTSENAARSIYDGAIRLAKDS